MKKAKETIGETVQINDLFRPMNNKVLVELIFEGTTYGDTGIYKLDAESRCEPYVIITAVPDVSYEVGEFRLGDQTKLEIGQYAITRKDMSYNSFPLYNKWYALIDMYDIYAVVSPEIIEQIKSNIEKAVNKPKIQIVN